MNYKGYIACLLSFPLWLSSCYSDKEEVMYRYLNTNDCDTTHVDYTHTVTTIMQQHCNTCHQSGHASGNVITDGYVDLKTIVDNGKLMGSILHLTGFVAMPQGGNSLSDCEIASLRAWIQLGAPNN